MRAVAEPSGALALAGMKKYIARTTFAVNGWRIFFPVLTLNFHGLRYVSERCELGEQREALLAVTIPEEKGSFLKFCQLLGGARSPSSTTALLMPKTPAFLSACA